MINRLRGIAAAAWLFSAAAYVEAEVVTFHVDADLSVIQLIDSAFLAPDQPPIPLPAQVGTGDTVNYTGTLTGDLVGNTLSFSGGSEIRALEHPLVEDFIPEEEGPGGPEDADAQDINYAYELEEFPGYLFVQLFDIALDLTSGSVTHGQPANQFVADLDEGGYAIVLEDPDIINDTSWFNKPFDVITMEDPAAANTSTENATLTVSEQTQTLTIPVELEYLFEVDLCCGDVGPTLFNLTGQIVATRTIEGLPGDYNGNGQIDSGDLDVHAQYIQDGNLAGDVNADGVVNTEDRARWAEIYQQSWLGDSNFDGQFDEQDIVDGFIAGKYLTGELATYAAGDWDGDMLFDENDFVAVFIEGGYLMGPRGAVAAVPEPASSTLILIGLLGLAQRRRV